MRLRKLAVTVASSGCLAAMLATGPAAAQTDLAPDEGFGARPRIGVGVVTNAPALVLGGSAFAVLDAFGGLGLYVDARRSLESPGRNGDFVDSLSVSDVDGMPGQRFQRDDQAWWSINAAVVRPVSPELMIYVGAGYVWEDLYRRYQNTDPDVDLGTLGWYWVHDDEGSAARVNYLAGALFRMTPHIALQFGLESAPPGFTVGGVYSFSLR